MKMPSNALLIARNEAAVEVRKQLQMLYEQTLKPETRWEREVPFGADFHLATQELTLRELQTLANLLLQMNQHLEAR